MKHGFEKNVRPVSRWNHVWNTVRLNSCDKCQPIPWLDAMQQAWHMMNAKREIREYIKVCYNNNELRKT